MAVIVLEGGQYSREGLALTEEDQSDHCSHMREVTAKEAEKRFGQLLRAAQRGPVFVTRNGNPVGVVMSVDQFDRMRAAAWDRVRALMDTVGQKAAANGLTPEILESLLADES